MSTSPTSPKSPKSPPTGLRSTSPDQAGPISPKMVRERSGSWLSRRRSGSVQAPGSPVVTRGARSPSSAGATRAARSMSLSLDTSEQTLPDVLGALLLSPRADRLEGEFVIEDETLVKNSKLLNSAGLSHFFMAEYKGKKVLQKVIKYRNIDDKVLASFEKEVAVLSTLSHPNIVTFIGAKATPPDLFMLLEWMARGSLSSILLKDLSVEIAWNQRIKWSHDVAKGIEYLHSLRPKIIHRDLRSDNVMVNAAGDAKLSEFGLSRRKRFHMKASPRSSVELPDSPPSDGSKGKEEGAPPPNQYTFVSEGGPSFTAPELLLAKSYTEKVDSFNFGILVWQIMTRQVPHRGKSSIEIAEAVVQRNLRPQIPDYVPEGVKTIIEECWAQEEDGRPAFEVIVPKLGEILAANLEPELPTEDIESISEGSRHNSLSVTDL